MMIARWQIEARFGHKQTVIDMLKRWESSADHGYVCAAVPGQRLGLGGRFRGSFPKIFHCTDDKEKVRTK